MLHHLFCQICAKHNMGRWLWEQLGGDDGKKHFIIAPWMEKNMANPFIFEKILNILNDVKVH